MPAPTSSPPPAVAQEHAWMGVALEAAARAGRAGDVPIGAVVVDGRGQVLAAVGNEREQHHDPTAHAEVLALRRAAAVRAASGHGDGWRLEDCTLVVTLEPCPMCAGALLLARIPRVVFGAWDPKAGGCGSVLDVVRDPRFNHAVEVRAGVRAPECAALLRDFFAGQRAQAPAGGTVEEDGDADHVGSDDDGVPPPDRAELEPPRGLG